MKKYIVTLIISSMILVNSAFADSNSISTIKYNDNLQITLKGKAYTGKYVNDSLIKSLNKSLIGKNNSDKINGIKSIILKIDGVIVKLSLINNTNRNNLISVLQNMKNYYNEQINELTKEIENSKAGGFISDDGTVVDSMGTIHGNAGIGVAGANAAAVAQKAFDSMTKEEQKLYEYNKYGVYDGITRQEAINNTIKQGEYKTIKKAEINVDYLIKTYGLIVK